MNTPCMNTADWLTLWLAHMLMPSLFSYTAQVCLVKDVVTYNVLCPFIYIIIQDTHSQTGTQTNLIWAILQLRFPHPS